MSTVIGISLAAHEFVPKVQAIESRMPFPRTGQMCGQRTAHCRPVGARAGNSFTHRTARDSHVAGRNVRFRFVNSVEVNAAFAVVGITVVRRLRPHPKPPRRALTRGGGKPRPAQNDLTVAVTTALGVCRCNRTERKKETQKCCQQSWSCVHISPPHG
jgi:hypothetical protein